MSKNTVLRVLLLLIIGGVIGAVSSFGLFKLNELGYINDFNKLGMFFIKNNIIINIALIVVLYLPAIYLHIKGRKILSEIADEQISEEEIDDYEKIGSKAFDKSLAINTVFLILNFMLLGMTFDPSRNDFVIVLSLFMVSILASSSLEIITVKFIQKIDNRLKGDPTSLKFNKDFLESCDEAERLKIYKAGYKSFQFSRNAALVFVLISIIGNMILETGSFPVFVSCMLMLLQVSSYNYYAIKANK